jgi:CRP/FNR family transcriptional regulator, cyclic AMP receptor protein
MKEFAYIHEHGHVPSALRTLPFLGSFDDEQLDDVLDSSNYVQCEPGDFIIDEGAIDSRIYILLRGEVEVRRDGKLLATIGRAGEVFGELAVVNEDRRSASVLAKTPVVCLAVDQKFLQDIKPREEYPAFYASLYEFIARLTAGRLEATSRKLTEVQNELRRLKEKLAAEHVNARRAKRAKPAATKRKLPVRRRARRIEG